MTAEDKAKNAGKVALVLEGGSFRGQFTAGVLDVLMEAGVEIPAVYGVSAGALNGVNYKSHQIGRVNRINLTFCNDNRYMGAASFASTGSIVGYDFIFNDIQDRLDPFDNEAFDASPIEMYAVATDMLFGTAAYLPVKSAVLDLDAVRASTSLPLVTPPVEIDGHKYVDGGVADSVPIEYVLEEAGFDRAVVIVTQDRSYEKKPYEFCRRRVRAMPTTPICSRLSRRATTAITSSACTCGSMSARAAHWSLLRKSRSRSAMSSMIRPSFSTCISRAARRQSACWEISRLLSSVNAATSRLVDDMCRNSGRSQNTC